LQTSPSSVINVGLTSRIHLLGTVQSAGRFNYPLNNEVDRYELPSIVGFTITVLQEGLFRNQLINWDPSLGKVPCYNLGQEGLIRYSQDDTQTLYVTVWNATTIPGCTIDQGTPTPTPSSKRDPKMLYLIIGVVAGVLIVSAAIGVTAFCISRRNKIQLMETTNSSARSLKNLIGRDKCVEYCNYTNNSPPSESGCSGVGRPRPGNFEITVLCLDVLVELLGLPGLRSRISTNPP
jgi:hypothetical protein